MTGDGHFGNPLPWFLLMLVPLSPFQSKLCWHLLVPMWGRASLTFILNSLSACPHTLQYL